MLSALKKFSKNFYFIFISCAISACNNNKSLILYSMLTQADANKIILLLSNNAINAEKQKAKDGTYSILIEPSDQANAIDLIVDNGLPNSKFTNLGEIFKKDGFISSPIEEKSRFIYGLQEEISSMLMQFNGVIAVQTNVSMPIFDDLGLNENISSAAVLIKYKYGYNISIYLPKIKSLVAKSVPGLSIDRVEVTIVPIFAD